MVAAKSQAELISYLCNNLPSAGNRGVSSSLHTFNGQIFACQREHSGSDDSIERDDTKRVKSLNSLRLVAEGYKTKIM